jgi:carotenoid 1,2-hydratase
MHQANPRDAGAMRPHDSDERGANGGHDADGLQPHVPGNRGGAVRPQLARLDGVIQAAGSADETSGSLPRGRECASGTGRPDGSAIGVDGGGEPDRGPHFDRIVAKDGYAWWYVDALSDDGKRGITLIAFVGSVFSPYYAFARRLGRADPLDHCALNVALYGNTGKRWAMTERRRSAIRRSANEFVVGPSSIDWSGETLTFRIDEITNPFPSRLQGTVRVYPSALTRETFKLDAAECHRWRPFAPCARVQVEFRQPATRWLGDGYCDINHGDAPLERDFSGWQWSRASTRKGTVISYDTFARGSGRTCLALNYDRAGVAHHLLALPRAALPPTGWRIPRSARGDARQPIVVKRTLEDAPFYARSQLSAKLHGESVDVMHESLSLDRFRKPIVQVMLPFRMPRW